MNDFPTNFVPELAIISDVHLTSSQPARTRLFVEALAELRSRKVPNVVLLGDIFDFYFGRKHSYFLRKFPQVFTEFELLAQHTKNFIYIEGNHEFDLASSKWDNIEVLPVGTKIIQLPGGKRVALSHGDLLYCTEGYKRFRDFVKAPWLWKIAEFVPAWLINFYAIRHSEISRAQDPYRKIHKEQIVAAMHRWALDNNADLGIFGHFHYPFDEQMQQQGTRPARLLSVKSWIDEPNILLVDSQGEIARTIVW